MALVIIVELLTRLRRLAFLLLIKCPAPVRFRFTFPLAVTLTRLFKPLWVFCFGIGCFPLKKTCPTSALKDRTITVYYTTEQCKRMILFDLPVRVNINASSFPKNRK